MWEIWQNMVNTQIKKMYLVCSRKKRVENYIKKIKSTKFVSTD